MEKLNLQNVNFGSKKAENKAKKLKKEAKKKISENPKNIKLALAGLAVLGTAAAAGVMIYRGKLNAENLEAIAPKAKDRVAEQAQQAIQSIQKNEAPGVPVIEKKPDVVAPEAVVSKAIVPDVPNIAAKPKDEYAELLAKRDELTPSAFKRLAGLIQGKTEEQEAEIARIFAEKHK